MTAALPLESRPRSRRLFFSSIATSGEGVPATWSRARRAAAPPFPARLATSWPRSTIATFDDAPRAPSPVPTMTAAGAGSRIAASDDEIHSLTLEGRAAGDSPGLPLGVQLSVPNGLPIFASIVEPVSSAPCQPFWPIIGMLRRPALRNLRSSSVDNGGLRT